MLAVVLCGSGEGGLDVHLEKCVWRDECEDQEGDVDANRQDVTPIEDGRVLALDDLVHARVLPLPGRVAVGRRELRCGRLTGRIL